MDWRPGLVRATCVVVGLVAVFAGAVFWIAGRPEVPPWTQTTVTRSVAGDKTTTTTRREAHAPPRQVVRSETITLAVLGGGMLLLLIAAFPDRLPKVTTPSGWSLEFAAVGESVVKRLVEEAGPDVRSSPELMGTAFRKALEDVTPDVVDLGSNAEYADVLDQAVADALHDIAARASR